MKKLFLFGAIALLLATVGCGDDEKKVEKEKERIAGETPQELLGRWGLTGYGSEKGVVPVEGNCKDYYEITFLDDNAFIGFTEFNQVGSPYKIYPNVKEIELGSDFHATKKTEDCQWLQLQESLSKITSYDFSTKGELFLYFNDKKDWIIFKKHKSNLLKEIPKFYAKGNIEVGEQKVIQTKEELLAVFSQETIDKVEGLNGIDFSTQTLLLGRDSKSSAANTFRYRYSQIDATTYRLFVEITGGATVLDPRFCYGVVVDKVEKESVIIFKIIKR